MTEKLLKILSILIYTLIGISSILIILFYLNAIPIDVVIYWAYILIFITIFIAIAAPVIQFIKNPAKAKGALIGIAAFIILFVISYFIASNSIEGKVYESFNISVAGSRRIGSIIIATYFIGAITILSAIYSGVSKMFKKS